MTHCCYTLTVGMLCWWLIVVIVDSGHARANNTSFWRAFEQWLKCADDSNFVFTTWVSAHARANNHVNNTIFGIVFTPSTVRKQSFEQQQHHIWYAFWTTVTFLARFLNTTFLAPILLLFSCRWQCACSGRQSVEQQQHHFGALLNNNNNYKILIPR